VSVNRSEWFGSAQPLSILLPNGTYNFTVNPPVGVTVDPANGSFQIHGANRTVNLVFMSFLENQEASFLGMSAAQWDGVLIVVLLIATVAIIIVFHRRKS
jgi:hypothetical protein